MNKFWIWTLIGVILAWRWSQQLLGKSYYSAYISEPLKQKIDVFDLIPEPVEEESEQEEPAWFDASILTKYEEIFSILEQQYIDDEDVDFIDMQDNALKGFVEAIGDPYTSYLDKQENTAFDEAIQGTQNFEWIGAVVMKRKDGVQIEEVLKNSPAFLAWLQALDLILQIEEEPIQDLDLFESVQKIRGPKWSEVSLTIYREKTEEILEITVTRDTIDVPSVTANIIDQWWKKLLYLEIATFWEDTATKMQEAITPLLAQNPDGVILDLRGNGGWILPISVDVAWYFIPKGEIVTKVEYSIFPDEFLRSQWGWVFEDLPVVVLIDGMSASASEIVAWALRDDIWALLVGTTSFGKWSVQTIRDLDDGSSLKFSVGKRYTPNGINVNEDWLVPDIEIEFDRDLFVQESVDTQLEEAKEQLDLLLE